MTIKLNNKKDLDRLKTIIIKATRRGIDGGRNCINWDALAGTEAACSLAVEEFANSFMDMINSAHISCDGELPFSTTELITISERYCLNFIIGYFPEREHKRKQEQKDVKRVLKIEITLWAKRIKDFQRKEKENIKAVKRRRKMEIFDLKLKIRELRG